MDSEKQKMLDGELYSPFSKELNDDRVKAKKLLHKLNVTEYLMSANSALILKELLPNAPKDIYIEPPFHCDYGYNIHCGSRVYFNVNCVVLDVMKVTIGENVLFGPGVNIYTASHPLDAKTRRTRALAKPVTIGNDCWIGGGAIICPGVTIGNGSVIGAGAVVINSIPENSLAVGNPAKVIRKLNQS
ncbi:sugar O-acetyltransferase [Aurantibacillus circumpalustris]|uniref:sugar O-acetyltransferase n=1 Tax=Aurantibacillus circumpalustris TaxID=3036359 RepID=UPI00295C31AF|nr:sugar O-acetyltransferase [Aurantibacillus circumpalustris]